METDYLEQASNLQTLVVQRFSPDILAVVQSRARARADDLVLTSLSVVHYFENMLDPEYDLDESREVDPEGALFLENHDQSGLHWQHLSIGEKAPVAERHAAEAEHLLREYLPECANLKELSFPLSATHLVSG